MWWSVMLHLNLMCSGMIYKSQTRMRIDESWKSLDFSSTLSYYGQLREETLIHFRETFWVYSFLM